MRSWRLGGPMTCENSGRGGRMTLRKIAAPLPAGHSRAVRKCRLLSSKTSALGPERSRLRVRKDKDPRARVRAATLMVGKDEEDRCDMPPGQTIEERPAER